MRAHTSFEARSPHHYRSSSRMEHVNIMPMRSGSRFRGVGTQTELDSGEFLPVIAKNRPASRLQQSWDERSYANNAYDTYNDQNVAYSYDNGMHSPAFNNYYQRVQHGGHVFMKKRPQQNEDMGAPIFRYGRLGAPWRHIKQCTGNLGNHICFIDGTVKQDDAKVCPPYGLVPEGYTYISPRLKSAPPRRLGMGSNTFNEHAKNNFRYWHESKKYSPGAPKQTIAGRMMKLGVGY